MVAVAVSCPASSTVTVTSSSVASDPRSSRRGWPAVPIRPVESAPRLLPLVQRPIRNCRAEPGHCSPKRGVQVRRRSRSSRATGSPPTTKHARLGVGAQLTAETTFLGAHVVPPEFDERVDDYVELVCGEMLTACAPHSRWIDAFCERGAFDVDQSRAVLLAGRAAGLGMRLHANQLGHGPGVKLAVELGCASADHCTYLDDDDIAALAGSGTVATFLPAADFSTRQPYPDARRLLDAGGVAALAANCNPGSSYTTSMPFCIALAVRDMNMTIDEAIWAATAGGAAALRRDRHRQHHARRPRRSDHPQHRQSDRLRLPTGCATRGDDDHRRSSRLIECFRRPRARRKHSSEQRRAGNTRRLLKRIAGFVRETVYESRHERRLPRVGSHSGHGITGLGGLGGRVCVDIPQPAAGCLRAHRFRTGSRGRGPRRVRQGRTANRHAG